MKTLFRKKSISDIQPDKKLNRILTIKDLIFFGIAGIIGAGIFSTIGKASYVAGPSVIILFGIIAIACIFTALCYAQFASMVPLSGSAYTYAYVSVGEFFAWIIGWALILEYAVANVVATIAWSKYFNTMLKGFNIHIPDYLTVGTETAYRVNKLAESGAKIPDNLLVEANAYANAPEIFGLKIVLDLPAGLIILLLTVIIYLGIRSSKIVSNFLVWLKLGVIVGIIILGSFYVKPENWVPFAPNGIPGILGGIATVFFSFIGFDAISTTAEECKNPQKDIPRAMIACIAICTFLYILMALVLTGMISFDQLNVNNPLAYVFGLIGMDFVAGVIAICAVIAITGAILAFQVAQPRIWMAMSRDGLLGKNFSQIHPRYKTPGYGIVIAGLAVGLPSMFFDIDFMIHLASMGTFFAFIVVCIGILYLDIRGESKNAKFKIPYVNSNYFILPVFVITVSILIYNNTLVEVIKDEPLMILFFITWLGLGLSSIKYKYSLIPILGILINVYLMTHLGASNWFMFLLWALIGLIVYALYGYKKSKLASK